MKKKRNRKEDRKLLFNVAKNYIEPLKHSEFKCPICGGVATVYVEYDKLNAECHAEGLSVSQRV